jgi:hypothetical protein
MIIPSHGSISPVLVLVLVLVSSNRSGEIILLVFVLHVRLAGEQQGIVCTTAVGPFDQNCLCHGVCHVMY